jgi:hypothetical protein
VALCTCHPERREGNREKKQYCAKSCEVPSPAKGRFRDDIVVGLKFCVFKRYAPVGVLFTSFYSTYPLQKYFYFLATNPPYTRLIIELIRHELPLNKLRNLFKAYKQENPEFPDFFLFKLSKNIF